MEETARTGKMSGDEMREQRVRVAIDLEDAEAHLNALRVSAAMHGDALIKLGVQLRDHPETIYRDGASGHYGYPIESFYIIDDQTARALEIQKILTHGNEIRKEIERVEVLRRRLASISSSTPSA